MFIYLYQFLLVGNSEQNRQSTIVEADVSSVQAAAWQTQCRTLCDMMGSWLTLGGQLAVTKWGKPGRRPMMHRVGSLRARKSIDFWCMKQHQTDWQCKYHIKIKKKQTNTYLRSPAKIQIDKRDRCLLIPSVVCRILTVNLEQWSIVCVSAQLIK